MTGSFNWVVPAIKAASKGQQKKPIKPEWAKLAGSCGSLIADTHILFPEGAMSMTNPKPSAIILVPVAEVVIKIHRKPGTSGYGSVGETISCEFGPDQKVQRVKIGANYAQPFDDGLRTTK